MKKSLLISIYFLIISGLTNSYGQITLASEDFDGGSVNLFSTTNVDDYGATGGSGGDVFGRVDGRLNGTGMPFDVADDTVEDVSGARTGSSFPTDQLGIAGQNTTSFFALNDADGVGVNNALWVFSGWGTATIFDIQIDIAAMGDFEASSSDGFLIEASLDSGPFQEIFKATTDEAAFKSYRPLDGGFVFSDDDPLELFIDGATTSIGFLDKCDPLTGNFDTYVSTLLSGQSASEVQIRMSWSGSPSGSEPMGIDNISIRGSIAGPPQLVITEIMYNPSSSEDNWEWVEVYNSGATSVDMTGFVIDDSNSVSHSAANISGGTIPAGQSAILFNADDVDAVDFLAAWGSVDLIPVSNWSAMALNNGGDTVGIWSDFASYSGDHQSQLNVIDNVNFDDSSPWPVDDGSASIYLTDLTADNDNGANWALSTDGGVTPLYTGYTSTSEGGNSGNDVASPGVMSSGIMPLLLSEIAVTPTAGEFIEIYNPNASAVDLTNVYITDATFSGGGTYYYNIVTGVNAGGGSFSDFLARFPSGSSIAPGEYQTIAISGSDNYAASYGMNPTYELYEDGAPDSVPNLLEGLPGSINGQGGLTNSGEIVIMFYWDGMSDLVTDLDYVVWGDKAEAVDKSGVSIDGPDADSVPSTYANDTPIANQQSVAAGSHSNGDSFQRNDQSEGAEILNGGNGAGGHDETSEDLANTWCSSSQSVGMANNCGPEIIPISFIHEVQGSGLNAAEAGNTVRVEALVVGDFQNGDQLKGFFIQEEDIDADSDPATSEGIFIYCNTCPVDVSVGDLVDITGLAGDFFGMTQIDITVAGGLLNIVSSGNTLPTPASISLPAADSTEAEGTFENVEGMLINFGGTLSVAEYFELQRYGQLVLSNGRIKQFTDTNQPDVVEYSAFLTQLNQSRIILDDDNNRQNAAIAGPADKPYFWPRPGASNTNVIRGGDQIVNLTGIMHWSFAGQSGTDAWRIRPVEEAFNYDFTPVNPRSTTPEDVGGSFKVASYNVLNYFTTLNERGANSDAELDRQREKIASAICSLNADVIGLIELENNGSAIEDLLNGPNGINTQCANTYAALNTGIIGTDQITVGFIYNTATTTLDGAYAVLDSSVDPRFKDDYNRPALAQSFRQTQTGGLLTVVVNHFKSKGSSCDNIGDPNINDGSGNCNLTRAEAAAALVDWLATDPTESSDPDFLIIGDLNSYRNELPIVNLKNGSDDIAGTSDDFIDLLDANIGANAYSFVFDGQLGYLDYAIANSGLSTQVTGITSWHINSDEFNIYDYNDGIQNPGEAFFERKSNALPIYESNAFRSSDHDPILVGLDLGVPPLIECPENIILNNSTGDCGTSVSFPIAAALDPDNDLVSLIQTSGLTSGSQFPVGESVIEFTATDAVGHITVCSFTVTIIDNEPAVAVCQDITVELDANGFAVITASQVDGGSTDNCGIASINLSKETFDCSNIGANNITFTVTDVNGNESTCTAVVTILDVINPVAICQNITVQLDTNGLITVDPTLLDAGSNDECGISNITLDINTFDCSNVGDNTVTLFVTDPSGNVGSCTAIITVEDDIEPELICRDIIVELDENGMAVISPEDVIDTNTDICGISTTSIDIFEFDCGDIGAPIIVNVFSQDNNGNLSSCTAEITVVDSQAPEVICPEDQTIDPGPGNLFYEVPDYWASGEATTTDNCTEPVNIFSQDPEPGTSLVDGIYTVTLCSTDENGNEGCCTFELTIESTLSNSDLDFETGVSLFPNPSNNLINIINDSNTQLLGLAIYDINGRLIMNVPIIDGEKVYAVDTYNLASGIYMIELKGQNSTLIKRFIKR